MIPRADPRTGKVQIPSAWQALALELLAFDGTDPSVFERFTQAAKILAREVMEASEHV